MKRPLDPDCFTEYMLELFGPCRKQIGTRLILYGVVIFIDWVVYESARKGKVILGRLRRRL